MNNVIKELLVNCADSFTLDGEATTAEALWQQLVTHQAQTDGLDMTDETVQDYAVYAIAKAFDFVCDGDEFPTARVNDLITLQSYTADDYWKPIFEANLDTQAWVLSTMNEPERVSSLLFGAVVDTAFSFIVE